MREELGEGIREGLILSCSFFICSDGTLLAILKEDVLEIR